MCRASIVAAPSQSHGWPCTGRSVHRHSVPSAPRWLLWTASIDRMAGPRSRSRLGEQKVRRHPIATPPSAASRAARPHSATAAAIHSLWHASTAAAPSLLIGSRCTRKSARKRVMPSALLWLYWIVSRPKRVVERHRIWTLPPQPLPAALLLMSLWASSQMDHP